MSNAPSYQSQKPDHSHTMSSEYGKTRLTDWSGSIKVDARDAERLANQCRRLAKTANLQLC